MSPYQYTANNPILFVDVNGDSIAIKIDDNTTVFYNNGQLVNKNGEEYQGESTFATKVLRDLNQLTEDHEDLGEIISILTESENVHIIQMTDKDGEGNSSTANTYVGMSDGIGTGSTIRYNPDNVKTIRGDIRTPRAGLAHELSHSTDTDLGDSDMGKTDNGIEMREVDAVNMENRARAAAGDPKRTKYGGKQIPKHLLDDTHKKKN